MNQSTYYSVKSAVKKRVISYLYKHDHNIPLSEETFVTYHELPILKVDPKLKEMANQIANLIDQFYGVMSTLYKDQGNTAYEFYKN